MGHLGSAQFPTVKRSSFLSNDLDGLSMCSRHPKLLWTVGTWSNIASIREPSVHEGFPSCLVLSIPNTPESCLVRSIPNSLFLLNALLNQWIKQADCVGLIQVHLLFGPELNKERHGQVTQMGKGTAVEDQGQRILYQVGTERRFSTFMFVPERSQTMLGKGQVRYFVLG